jgi:hypothetical protein
MSNMTEHDGITPESVLASVKEMFAETRAEMKESSSRFDRELVKSAAEFDRRSAEFDRKLAESKADFDRKLAESRENFEQEMKQSRENSEQEKREFNRRMKNLDEMIGGVSNSNGMAAEELFFNTFDNGDKKIFGEQFDLCYRNLSFHDKSKKKRNEFDIVLVNGKVMAIVEIKYKARKEDIQKMIGKVPDFKTYFPHYNGHRVFLGLAAMAFDKGVEKNCTDNGIAIVKQVGDAVVINDKHLKVF